MLRREVFITLTRKERDDKSMLKVRGVLWGLSMPPQFSASSL